MRKAGSVYWHVGNSGVTFEVVDQGQGPTFIAKSGAFGNINSTFEAHTDEYSLRMLALMLFNAADRRYSEIYVHPAVASPPRKATADSTSTSTGRVPDGSKSSQWHTKAAVPAPTPAPVGKSHVRTLFESPRDGDEELTALEGAHAILTGSAVFARTPHILVDKEAYDLLRWFPNLGISELRWLWDHGFLYEKQYGVLAWNPSVKLFSTPETKREESWQDAISGAADITRRMPVTGGPTPLDMGKGPFIQTATASCDHVSTSALLTPSLPLDCKCGPQDACPRCNEELNKAHNAPPPPVQRRRRPR